MDITKFTKSQHFEEIYVSSNAGYYIPLSNQLSERLEKQLSKNKFAEIHQVITGKDNHFIVIFNIYN